MALCPEKVKLRKAYTVATTRYAVAVDRLLNARPTSDKSDYDYEDAKRSSRENRLLCRAAHQALEEHIKLHRC